MGFYGDFNGINGTYPLVNIQIAIEAMAIEIVDFPINSMVIFPSATLNYQRVLFVFFHPSG